MKLDKPLRLRIDKELHAKLRRDARARKVSVSDVVREILVKHYDTRKSEEVLEALLKMILADEELKQLVIKKTKEKG
jgi:2-hydroxy-3-keto-5-methylthiopentenyl-1-phosphate phosphatase